MPHPQKILFDDLFKIKVSDIKKYGTTGATVRLERHSEAGPRGGMEMKVKWRSDSQDVLIKIKSWGDLKEQRIGFTAVKCNLNENADYFLLYCPITGEKCFKLYFYNGRFVGRKAIEDAKYRIQVCNGERPSTYVYRLGKKIRKINQLLKELESFKGRRRWIRRTKLISQIQLLTRQIA